ncbi:MAG: alpha amylase C-terminal domain-containing protein, partial [Chloroflexota bacterium]|nr:alpha amylase C-terminal domain-containing protein [Chloroflexota bacterium]
YRIPAPAAGRYRLALNTDAREWGGSGAGGPDVVEAEAREHKGHPHSLSLTLPPLGALFLKADRPAVVDGSGGGR